MTEQQQHHANASEIKAPLEAGSLSLTGFDAREGLSQIAEFQLEVRSETVLDTTQLLGKTLAVGFRSSDENMRWVHGHITRVAGNDRLGVSGSYTVSLRPWLWLLTLSIRYRVFQQKSVIEILAQLLKAYSGTVDWQVTGTYEAMDYCVQYGESDFAFFSRLMERAGLYYFFSYQIDGHQLVIVDSMSAHKAVGACSEMRFRPALQSTLESLSSWSQRSEMVTGKVKLIDFDFSKANTREASIQSGDAVLSDCDLDCERTLYPGQFADHNAGNAAAKVQVEAISVQHNHVLACHSSPYLVPGYCFELADHPLPTQNGKYLVIESTLHGTCLETTGGQGEFRFSGEIKAIKTNQVFRAPIITPIPNVAGPQTAFVVGKAGEDLWVDQYGRVKIQFHWDDSDRENENCSCWVRVAQPLAGKRWGAMFLPRIGQEVVVQFLEGNPDRPLIVGGVYNVGARPPWELPGHASRSGLKSQSLGDVQTHNELRFEDKDGSEQLLIYAGRNQDTTVVNDAFVNVGNDWHMCTGANQFIKVSKDLHQSVEGNCNTQVGQSYSLSVAGDSHSKVVGKQYLTTDSLDCSGTQTVTIEAGSQLVLKVGSSSVVLSSSGVAINGGEITIDGSSMVDINAGGGASAVSAEAAQPLAVIQPEVADNGQA